MSKKNLHILVVDDNMDSAMTLVWLLETMGYDDCSVAHDGPQALAMAKVPRRKASAPKKDKTASPDKD